MRQILLVVIVLLALPVSWTMTSVHAQVIGGDFTGGTLYTTIGKSGVIYAFPILITSPSVVCAIGVNWAGTGLVTVNVALYSNNYTSIPYRPSSLLTDSGFVLVATSGGWQDIPVALKSVTYGNYWWPFKLVKSNQSSPSPPPEPTTTGHSEPSTPPGPTQTIRLIIRSNGTCDLSPYLLTLLRNISNNEIK